MASTVQDAVTMAVIADVGGEFGKQRLMSMLSLGFLPLISSIFVHNSGRTAQGIF